MSAARKLGGPMHAAELGRLGWRRIDGGSGKCSAEYFHAASGWRIQHCGHPTANHPYLLIDPQGRPVLTGAEGPKQRADFGTAWNSLNHATGFHQRHVAGEAPFGGPYRSDV